MSFILSIDFNKFLCLYRRHSTQFKYII